MLTGRAGRQVVTAVAIGRLLTLYASFALLKHIVPLGALARLAWHRPAASRNRDAERRLVARVIKLRALTRHPDADCLQRSLLLYRELSRLGADPVLAVGVARVGGRVRGHAWVLVDDTPVVDALGAGNAFTRLCHFGRRGQVVGGGLGA